MRLTKEPFIPRTPGLLGIRHRVVAAQASILIDGEGFLMFDLFFLPGGRPWSMKQQRDHRRADHYTDEKDRTLEHLSESASIQYGLLSVACRYGLGHHPGWFLLKRISNQYAKQGKSVRAHRVVIN